MEPLTKEISYSTKELNKQRTFKFIEKSGLTIEFLFCEYERNYASTQLYLKTRAFISLPCQYYYQFVHNIEPDPLEETIFNENDYIICGRRAERSSAQEGIQDTVQLRSRC